MGGSPVHTLGPIKLLENIHSVELLKYDDYTNLTLMVSLLLVLQRAGNTMKNTIDDADYIINRIVFILIIQYVINSSHSHSIVNKPFLSFIFNGLFSC